MRLTELYSFFLFLQINIPLEWNYFLFTVSSDTALEKPYSFSHSSNKLSWQHRALICGSSSL